MINFRQQSQFQTKIVRRLNFLNLSIEVGIRFWLLML